MDSDAPDDFDIADPRFSTDPHQVYAHLREHNPVAVSRRWGGSVMLTRYDDITAAARSAADFSSASVSVAKNRDRAARGRYPALRLPPLTSDPPQHRADRRVLASAFTPRAAEALETAVRGRCNDLIDAFPGRPESLVDAVRDYATQIPAWVIARVLGIDPVHGPRLAEWSRSSLEVRVAEPDSVSRSEQLVELLTDLVAQARADDRSAGLLARLSREQPDWPLEHLIGTLKLLVVAGTDSTAQTLAAVLLHLAAEPDDQARLRRDGELAPAAVEELLRLHAPTTMARVATRDQDLRGVAVAAGTRVILPFPAANRDPAMFDRPDAFEPGRAPNPHVAFGAGIHRCLGAHLARMELRVAIGTWLHRSVTFRPAGGAAPAWVGGQVRGPLTVPVTYVHAGRSGRPCPSGTGEES